MKGKNEKYNEQDYYKCGLMKWSKTPILSRITLVISFLAMVISWIVLYRVG